MAKGRKPRVFDERQFVVHTDGACRRAGGVGGWGAVISWLEGERVLSGGQHFATNNQMEMMGAIAALEAIDPARMVVVITDSTYLCKGAKTWLGGWKHRDWVTRSGTPVKNRALWERLDAAMRRHHRVKWLWVKGHSGDKMNERADALAVAALKRIEGRGKM